MTGERERPPPGLGLFNDVDHPGYAVFIGHFAEAVRPEGLLPGHVNVAACGQVIEPALAFGDILGVEHQRKAGVGGIRCRRCGRWSGR